MKISNISELKQSIPSFWFSSSDESSSDEDRSSRIRARRACLSNNFFFSSKTAVFDAPSSLSLRISTTFWQLNIIECDNFSIQAEVERKGSAVVS